MRISNKAAEKITFIVQNMNIFNHFIILIAVCLFIFQSASAQKATAPSADLMIKNINVIDVKSGKIKHSVDVVILNLDNQIGTVEEGRPANLVILNKNPIENISNTKTIDGIILSGRYKSKTDLKNIEF